MYVPYVILCCAGPLTHCRLSAASAHSQCGAASECWPKQLRRTAGRQIWWITYVTYIILCCVQRQCWYTLTTQIEPNCKSLKLVATLTILVVSVHQLTTQIELNCTCPKTALVYADNSNWAQLYKSKDSGGVRWQLKLSLIVQVQSRRRYTLTT
jgi:hypothetical protein